MSQSYIPLYRKYRPQTFADLVGQEVVSKSLCNAIEMGKISHAYLFTGSRGTGKTSAARILAKSLNCAEGPTATPCGKCANCIDITNGSAIDVKEIDAASNNGVEDARDIIEKVQFVPVSGKYKIFIIDEVHMLSNQAFNALLKTLEEPPKNLVFILATTESHKVLETIVSRCQRFDFRKIKTTDIIKRLEFISKQEKISIEKSAIELIAHKSAGGLRDAIALLDQASVLGLGGNKISVDDVLSISGAISQDDLYAITSALAEKQSDVLISLINKITSQGNEPLLVLRELVGYFRNLLLVKTTGDASKISDLLAVSEKALVQLQEQSVGFEPIEIAQIIEKLAEYEVMLKNTTNQMMWIEVILVSILHRNDIKVISDLEKRVSALEAVVSGQGGRIETPKVSVAQAPSMQPVVQQPAPTPVAPKPIPREFEPVEGKTVEQESSPSSTKFEVPQELNAPGDLKQVWTELINAMEASARPFYIQMARPVDISANGVVIAIQTENWLTKIRESNKLQQLEAAVKNYFGKEVRVNLITFAQIPDVKKKLNNGSAEEKSSEISDKINIAPSEDASKQELPQNSSTETLSAEDFDFEIDEPEDIIKVPVASTASRKISSEGADMIIDLFQGKIIE